MNVLVTGATGFCGTHIIRHLIQEGHSIFALTRESNPEITGQLAKLPRVTVISRDLVDLQELPPAIDVIVHAAATSLQGAATVKDFVYDNIVGTHQLAAAAERSNARRIIYLSSLSLYGYVNVPILQETTAMCDPEPYGLSKYMAEIILRESTPSKPSISLRLPAVLGKSRNQNWFVKTTEKAARGEDIGIFDPDGRTNQAIYIEDLTLFIGKLVRQEFKNTDIVTIAASGGLTIRQIVEKMQRKFGSKSKIFVENSRRCANVILNDRAIKNYGYVPRDFEEVLERYFSSIEDRVAGEN